MNNNNKNNNNNYVCSVRAFEQKLWLSEMAATFFMNNLTVEEVFEAYYECRKTKRYSYGALSFEANYEENLVELYSELKNQTWKPGKSTCFIVNQPVKREIFAAPFRDRIVHHILIRRLNPYFEKYFINDSYACREGKGTHAAIERAAHFVRSVSKNNTQSAYVLKLDIKGFFMSINQKLLYEKLEAFIIKVTEQNPEMDRNFLLFLCRQIVFNDVCKDCMIRSPLKEWNDLPQDKSLFTAKNDCGLPIGNLTSQVFANFYLSEFDHFIKHKLKIKNYVRYVDDFVIIHKNKKYLKTLIPVIRRFLKNKLLVKLHPKKIYLQNVKVGFPYLGCFIKPEFITINKRVKNNFTEKLKMFWMLCEISKPTKELKEEIRASLNSYLGIMLHYKTWLFKNRQINRYFSSYLKNHFSVEYPCRKISLM